MSKNLISKLETALNSGILLQYVDDALASTQVLRMLGYSEKGQYIKVVTNFLLDNEIDISHFTHNGQPKVPRTEKTCPVCSTKFHAEARKTREQITCSRACSNTYFRTKDSISLSNYRSKALEVYGAKCSVCGYSDNILAIEVHHIDRNRNNNDICNLKVMCCNCHAIEHRTKETIG